jgi:hypothetical protein
MSTSDTAATEKPAQKTITPEQQSIIDRLVKLQSESRNSRGQPKTDKDFGESIGMSGSKWNLVKSGNYVSMITDIDGFFIDLKIALNKLQMKSLLNSRFGSKDFIAFPKFDAVFKAIETCLNKPLGDPIRFVVFLGETGCGKSALSAELMRRFEHVIATEARDEWMRPSKYVALQDICEAAEIDISDMYQPVRMEKALLQKFQEQQYILVIDEAEALGKGVLNSIKLWLNRSRLVVVALAIKGSYLKWNKRFPHEAAQIKSRTHTVIDNDMITVAEATAFLSQHRLNGDTEASAVTLARAATQFGGYRLIRRVLDAVPRGVAITKGDIDAALSVARANMGEQVK